MEVSSPDDIKDLPASCKAANGLDFAIFFAAAWITLILMASPLFKIDWFSPGDFTFTTAMFYHGLMVPLLVLTYLLTIKVLSPKLLRGKLYPYGAISSILLAGGGSIFNRSQGISPAAGLQISGMVLADVLGIVLVIALVRFALREREEFRKIKAAFWLLVLSVAAILAAASLGHLAGWSIDFDNTIFPGIKILLPAADTTPDELREALVSSHSHLIVAALICALTAITAILFQYHTRGSTQKRVCILGLCITMIAVVAAAVIYLLSAALGWEPPDLFVSGPNGIPLDDFVLTAGEIGFLVLMAGLWQDTSTTDTNSSPVALNWLKKAVFLNWIYGFIGAVVLGLYIEFHEQFYGGGEAPAPGALDDNIFIRVHLLYPFLLLPVLFAVLLAVGCKYKRHMETSRWLKYFTGTSIAAMSIGMLGELLWFIRTDKNIFVFSLFVVVVALVMGCLNLVPGKNTIKITSQSGF